MKTAFITGVSRGLGAGFAKALLNQGYTVYGLSRSTPPPEVATHPSYHFAALDLSHSDLIPTALDTLFTAESKTPVSHLDLVILNAGVIGHIQDLKDTPISELTRTMDINVWANKHIIDTLFSLVPSITQVVAISSGASRNGNRGWNGYAISKAALNMLIQLYAPEYSNTHFCALAPGLIDTSMQDYLCALPKSDKYPSIERLKEARHTPTMPTPDIAAKQLLAQLKKALTHPSGSYLDSRSLIR